MRPYLDVYAEVGHRPLAILEWIGDCEAIVILAGIEVFRKQFAGDPGLGTLHGIRGNGEEQDFGGEESYRRE